MDVTRIADAKRTEQVRYVLVLREPVAAELSWHNHNKTHAALKKSKPEA